jgi:hypothetical protein
VLPDGFMVLLGAEVGEPAALPVVVPLIDGLGELPAVELPFAVPLLLCAKANVLDSANAHANATVVIFMVVFLSG